VTGNVTLDAGGTWYTRIGEVFVFILIGSCVLVMPWLHLNERHNLARPVERTGQ